MKMLAFATALVLGAQATSPGSASVPGPQLLENPGFERGEIAWDMWGNGDLRDEYYGVLAHEGQNFLRIWSRSGWYQDYPTSEGKTYLVSAWVATAHTDALWGDAYGEVKVEWRKKTGDADVEVGENISVKFNVTGEGEANLKIPVDQWVKISLPPARAPQGATHIRVLVTIWTEGGQKGGGCALFDDLSCVETASFGAP